MSEVAAGIILAHSKFKNNSRVTSLVTALLKAEFSLKIYFFDCSFVFRQLDYGGVEVCYTLIFMLLLGLKAFLRQTAFPDPKFFPENLCHMQGRGNPL